MTDQIGKSVLNTSPAVAVKILLRQALKAALATLDRQTGSPYASLVTLAAAADGAPLILISRLAVHTQNILADPRAGLLIDATSAEGDPLAGGRVSLTGRLAATETESERRRFLARHPHAEMYAAFSDFAFYRFTIERAHFVGGFGRIIDLEPRDILVDIRTAASLVAAEPDILEHMNADHTDAIALYAAHKIGQQQVPSDWRMSGIDPEGLDLIGPSGALRIDFTTPIATPGDARKALAALAADARDRNPKPNI
jgi:putative heme iron utilization protein